MRLWPARWEFVADYARKSALDHGIDLTGGRITLLCYPRQVSSSTPLRSFRSKSDGQMALIIYEVRNTFGGIRRYLSMLMILVYPSFVRSRSKQFYVSPFIEHAMTYLFRIAPPARESADLHSGNRSQRPIARGHIQYSGGRSQRERSHQLSCPAPADDAENRSDPLGGLAPLA